MNRSIEGYEGIYEVSDIGQVFSVPRTVLIGKRICNMKGKVFKGYKSKVGYMVVNLSKDGITKQRYIHDLVARAFLGEKGKSMTINHKDGNKLNNHISNLEYCTYSENNEHARATGLSPLKIADYTRRKPVAMIDDSGEIIGEFSSALEAEQELGIFHISGVCRKQRQTAGGYKWIYL